MKILKNLDEVVAAILFMLVVLLTIINVFFRFFFSTINFGWASETITMLYVWCIFIGAAAVYRKRGHISIDAVVEHFSPRVRQFLRLLVDVCLLLTSGTVTWLSLDYVLHGVTKVMGVLRISYAYEYAAITVGFFLMMVYTVFHIIEDLQAMRHGEPAKEDDPNG